MHLIDTYDQRWVEHNSGKTCCNLQTQKGPCGTGYVPEVLAKARTDQRPQALAVCAASVRVEMMCVRTNNEAILQQPRQPVCLWLPVVPNSLGICKDVCACGVICKRLLWINSGCNSTA